MPTGLKVAAIGSATAEAARHVGFQVAVVPDNYVAESLVESLRDQVTGKRVLLPRAAVARDVIPDALRAAGAEVDAVEAYRNVMPEAAPEQLRRAVTAGLDAATFTSSSSVSHLAEAARAAGIAWPLAGFLRFRLGRLPARRCANSVGSLPSKRTHRIFPASSQRWSSYSSLTAKKWIIAHERLGFFRDQGSAVRRPTSGFFSVLAIRFSNQPFACSICSSITRFISAGE